MWGLITPLFAKRGKKVDTIEKTIIGQLRSLCHLQKSPIMQHFTLQVACQSLGPEMTNTHKQKAFSFNVS
jgi:hypothetical protein